MYFEETMARGDSGEHVTQLQEWLRWLGHYAGTIDGDFGEATEAAVQQFQESTGLDRDGQIQEQTWQALESQAGQSTVDDGGERQLSEDGAWWWDGANWQAVDGYPESAGDGASRVETVAAGILSEDGQWQWDGQQWLAAAPAPSDVLNELFDDYSEHMNGGTVNGVKLKAGVCNHPDEPADVLTGEQVAQFAKDAGFSGNALVTAVAVAKAESGWNRTCYSFTHDIGLWQINKVNWSRFGGRLNLYKGDVNASAAWELSSHGKSFKAWSAFNNGSFRQHLAEAQKAVDAIK